MARGGSDAGRPKAGPECMAKGEGQLYAGADGYRSFHQTIAQPMIAGEVEGTVDRDMGGWWQGTWLASGRGGTGVAEMV